MKEPQQPVEGELVKCVFRFDWCKDCTGIKTGCTYYETKVAQLAHTKARMVPSEDELALWLVGHLEYTSSELAKKLLGKLKGE